MNNIKAIVFDMDGLLLDTETIALSTFVAACREHNFEPDISVYYRCIGTTSVRTKEILMDGYGQGFHYESVRDLWGKKFQIETLKPIPTKMGAANLLEHLHKKGFKKAVATSTKNMTAQKELAEAGILQYFDFVVGGDEITNGKPHPEIYLTACRRLGEEPANCLALEDSDNGVRSATSAGLMVIQVPDLLAPSSEVKAFGHRIVKSLAEVESLLRQ